MKILFRTFRKKGSRDQDVSYRLMQGQPGNDSVLWFHGASAGEWECLIPVVERALRDGNRCVASVFSPSGWPSLERLQKSVFAQGMEPSLLITGFSPNEGDWGKVLGALRLTAFVTVKYEAWPELWKTLVAKKVPIFLLGAQSRPSLKWLSRILNFFGANSESVFFEVHSDEQGQILKEWFPAARVSRQGDPRWDRVRIRAEQRHPRAELFRSILAEKSPGRERTVGVLGSVWPEDLSIVAGELRRTQEKSDSQESWIFCVPHQVDGTSLEKVEDVLQSSGIKWVRSTDILNEDSEALQGTQFVVVNEIGFLLELYALADWAFVGGGFGSGIHSTLEPAYFSIPIATGPSRVDVFAETVRLRACGQLSVVHNALEFSEWVSAKHQEMLRKSSPQWQTETRLELGATERVWSWIREGTPVHQ